MALEKILGGSTSEANPPREAEDALVARAIEGDEQAFTELYDRYFDRLYRHVVYRVGRSHDAEDLTQQVFLQAWRGLPHYRQTGSPFVAWLMAIAHNVIVSFFRRSKDIRSLDADEIDWPSDERIDGTAEIRLETERVRQTMRRLKPEYQQVLAMRLLEDLPYPEIAAALGKTETNVRVMQHRALNELRRLLDRGER